MRRVYLVTRDFHLYLGLFISPFILVFALSVFYLVHAVKAPAASGPGDAMRTVSGIEVPAAAPRLEGRARLDALKPVLDRLGVAGEIDFVRHVASERRLVIPVKVPGRETIVDLDYQHGVASISTRTMPPGDDLIYLHKMPGPHN